MQGQRRAPTRVALGLVGFLLLGLLIEESRLFARARSLARDPAVPAPLLEAGAMGEILRGAGLVHQVHREPEGRWPFRPAGNAYTGFPRGVRQTDSAAAAREHLHAEWPLISITIPEEELHDPERGLYVHWERRNWERPAHVSLFDGPELIVSGGCGLRLHGGSSRRPDVQGERGVTWRSLRLYFRERYGSLELPPEWPLPGALQPLERLIVRGDSALSSALSFDIARRAGSPAPHMRPALYVLNGELHGLFSLTEHLSADTWAKHLGHEDFIFFRCRSSDRDEDNAAFDALRNWAKALPVGEATSERVGARVDLDNLARHMLVLTWCGTDDWAQGAAVLDKTEAQPLWRWVHWDMDRSFRRGEERDVDREWEKEALDLVLLEWPDGDPSLVERPEREDQTKSVRGILLRALLRDDPAFRKRFIELAVELMNHAWTTAFFIERLEYYLDYRKAGGIDPGEFLRVMRFTRRRHDFLRADLARVFELEPAFPVEVRAHEGIDLVVDGHAIIPPYRGWYFAGQRLRVEARCSDPAEQAVLYVNGQERARGELDLPLQGSLDVRVTSRPSSR